MTISSEKYFTHIPSHKYMKAGGLKDE
jgi:hypothetical protein